MSRKIMEAYMRSMKKDPRFRDTTSQIEQPTPHNEKKPKSKPKQTGNELNANDQAYINEIDRRMAASQKNEETGLMARKISKLENRVETLEKALKMVMENHKKLVRRL